MTKSQFVSRSPRQVELIIPPLESGATPVIFNHPGNAHQEIMVID